MANTNGTVQSLAEERAAIETFDRLPNPLDDWQGGADGGGSFTDEKGNTFAGPALGFPNAENLSSRPAMGSLTVGRVVGATRQQMFEAALSQPLSVSSTLSETVKEGVIKSLGLGTAVRDFTIPEGNPEDSGLNIVSPHPLLRTYEIARSAAQYFVNDEDSPALSEDAYKSSSYFRDGIPWDQAMTEQRAAALAASFDRSKVREYYAEKRPITAFIGNLGGQALDPINYIPVAGPLVRAAAVARLGKVAGAAVHGAVDAAGNTAVFSVATRDRRARYGDDVSWQTTVSEIATAALIGSAFGAIGGALEARTAPTGRKAIEARLSTLKTTQEARIALNEAIDAVVHGEDIKLSPNATGPMLRVADRIARDIPANEGKSVTVTKAATIEDVAESLRVVAARNPEMDPKTSPSEFDRLMIVDLQQRGFDGIKDEAMESPMPLSFNPEIIDVPLAMKDPVTRAAEIAMKPDSPEYARMQVEGSARELPRLEREIAIGNRMHNRLLRWADEKVMPGIALGKFDRLATAPQLARYHEQNIARYQTAATPEAAPTGRAEAERRIARPDDYRETAEQYRVNAETGSFDEESDIAQLAREGRLTEEDRLDLATAQSDYENAAAYGEALKAAVACLA